MELLQSQVQRLNQQQLQSVELLQMSSRKFHQTIVMITHNPDIAQRADRIVRIEDGRICQGCFTAKSPADQDARMSPL